MSSQKEKTYRLFFPSMEKRNSKSISEEISKILPSVEKEEVKLKTKEISNFLSVMRFRKNPVLFGRNIEDSLVMLFSEKQAKYSRNIEEDFETSAATFRRRPVVLGSLHATVLSRPADAWEVQVATTNSCEFRIGRLLVIRVLALFAFAVHADDVHGKSGYDASVFKRAAATVAFFCRKEPIGHFRVLLRFGFGFRGLSVSPALICKFSVLFVNSQSETKVNRT